MRRVARPGGSGLMPIYEQSYRRYEAREPLRQVRFWPITREALRLVLAKRAFLGLLVLSVLPFVVRVVQVYVVTRFPEAGRVLPVDGRLFGEFLNQQIGFTLLLTDLRGRRPHRQRPPHGRHPHVPVAAAHPARLRARQAGRDLAPEPRGDPRSRGSCCTRSPWPSPPSSS